MNRSKILVVGAGNVGETAAHIAASMNLGDVVLIDIVKGLGEGKALDLCQAGPVQLYDSKITGTTDWELTANSDVVIVTSGLPRKPGMSRDDLISVNAGIVKSVCEQIKKYSPNAFVIIVSNPLDAMVYTAAKVTGFAKNKVMGMAGALDCARYHHFIASEIGVSIEEVKSVLMGGHGDDMVPLPRFTTVSGIPVADLIEKAKLDAIIQRTRNGGIEIVNLLGFSAYYAPAAGAVKMAQAILQDKKSLICCSAYCGKEYNIGGFFVGVPVILGKNGVEKIIELKLNKEEAGQLDISINHVKELVAKVDGMI